MLICHLRVNRCTTQAQLSTQSLLVFLFCPYLAHCAFKQSYSDIYLCTLGGPTYSSSTASSELFLFGHCTLRPMQPFLSTQSGPNYSDSAVFQSCSWLISHLQSHVVCIFSCLHDQQLNHFIIATVIWSSHVSLALCLLGDAPTRPAYSFC